MSAPAATAGRAAGNGPPEGYLPFRVGSASVVALDSAAENVKAALAQASSLYDYAAQHPEARALTGRGIAYAAPLPGGGERVVIRRSRHGGLFAALIGERFLTPTRAPRELAIADRLVRSGVPTPPVIAIAIYPAGPLLRRSDVATREVPNARDLGEALAAGDAPSRELWAAAARLLAALARAGARHPDLNVKNILLARDRDQRLRAQVIDVDRVVFGRSCDPAIATANLARLERSALKWRDRRGVRVDEHDLAWLSGLVKRFGR